MKCPDEDERAFLFLFAIMIVYGLIQDWTQHEIRQLDARITNIEAAK